MNRYVLQFLKITFYFITISYCPSIQTTDAPYSQNSTQEELWISHQLEHYEQEPWVNETIEQTIARLHEQLKKDRIRWQAT